METRQQLRRIPGATDVIVFQLFEIKNKHTESWSKMFGDHDAAVERIRQNRDRLGLQSYCQTILLDPQTKMIRRLYRCDLTIRTKKHSEARR